MLTGPQALMVLKALIYVIPALVQLVRDGRIRATSQTEVLDALTSQFAEQIEASEAAARDADLSDAGELSDPNNRD